MFFEQRQRRVSGRHGRFQVRWRGKERALNGTIVMLRPKNRNHRARTVCDEHDRTLYFLYGLV